MKVRLWSTREAEPRDAAETFQSGNGYSQVTLLDSMRRWATGEAEECRPLYVRCYTTLC